MIVEVIIITKVLIIVDHYFQVFVIREFLVELVNLCHLLHQLVLPSLIRN